MSRKAIVFAAETTKNFIVNHRGSGEYRATIQNLTDQTVTITVTNEDMQGSSQTFAEPAAGALAIMTGAIGTLDEAYDGWLLTAGASASGTVNIVEPG